MADVGLARSGVEPDDVAPDGVLIERSARGRPDAFVEVARRHEVAMHGYLARRAGRQAADDLLAEVWLRAFAARGGYVCLVGLISTVARPPAADHDIVSYRFNLQNGHAISS